MAPYGSKPAAEGNTFSEEPDEDQTTSLPMAAWLTDLTDLPDTLDRLVPA